MALAFTTNTPRAGSRAMSAHHTEASGKKELPFTRIWIEPGEPVFKRGDVVIVVDKNSKFHGEIGEVIEPLTASKYLVRFKWASTAIHPMRKWQIAKFKKKPEAAKAAQIIPFRLEAMPLMLDSGLTQAVALLPAECESTRREREAHERFVAFMARIAALDIDDNETRRMNEILEKARNLRPIAASKPDYHGHVQTRQIGRKTPRIEPRLKIRSYAA